jgi:hypothetical protein
MSSDHFDLGTNGCEVHFVKRLGDAGVQRMVGATSPAFISSCSRLTELPEWVTFQLSAFSMSEALAASWSGPDGFHGSRSWQDEFC